jgi:hypothetical protein
VTSASRATAASIRARVPPWGIRDLVHRRWHLRWSHVALAAYIGLNVGLLLAWDMTENHKADWALWRALPDGLSSGNLYELETYIPFAWSPLMAPVMALVGWMGPIPWALVHLATVMLLRDWRLIGILLVSVGFWTNVAGGNTFTFVIVAGVLALRGSRGWAVVYLALFFLMPRPVQVPLALILVWRYPEIRVPAAALFVLYAVAVGGTGYAYDWLQTMASLGVPAWSIGPSYWLGLSWLAIGTPLGLLLLWRGHAGWAGLALSSYWVPAYLLMPLIGPLRSPALASDWQSIVRRNPLQQLVGRLGRQRPLREHVPTDIDLRPEVDVGRGAVPS